MTYIIAVLVGAYLLATVWKGIAKANPKEIQRVLARSAAYGTLLAAAILLAMGNLGLALALGLLGFWWIGADFSLKHLFVARKSGVSRMRSAMIEMEYDKASDRISGSVLAGVFEGRALADLARSQCMELHASCRYQDGAGARLLEAYFDRRFPGWRAAGESQPDPRQGRPGRSGAGAMSQDEAYEVLGLRQGSGREDIVRAHRTLIKKWHPDHGGSTDLAARVNEAKEVLMRRHN